MILFLKNFSSLGLASGLSRVSTLLIVPFLTRAFTPAQFGQWEIVMLSILIISNLSSARYENAIVLAKSDREYNAIVSLCMMLSLILCLLFSILVFTAGKFYFSFIELIHLPLIFLGSFLASLYLIISQAQCRFEYFKSMAMSRVIFILVPCLANLTILALPKDYMTSTNLIITSVLGSFIALIGIYFFQIKNIPNFFYLGKSPDIKEAAKNYSDLPKKNFFAWVCEFCQENLRLIILSKHWGPAFAGHFAITMKGLKAPMAIFSTPLLQIFFPKMKKMNEEHPEKLFGFMLKFLGIYTLCSAPFFILLYCYVDQIFLFLFGKGWVEAGTYFKILFPWFYVKFLTAPLSSIYVVLKKFDTHLKISSFFNLLLIGLYIYLPTAITISEALIWINRIGICYALVFTVYYLVLAKKA
jgi:O-antigen/teichoic acid export membrane protein